MMKLKENSVKNPNFRNSDKSLNTTLESTSSDFMTQSGYKLLELSKIRYRF